MTRLTIKATAAVESGKTLSLHKKSGYPLRLLQKSSIRTVKHLYTILIPNNLTDSWHTGMYWDKIDRRKIFCSNYLTNQ